MNVSDEPILKALGGGSSPRLLLTHHAPRCEPQRDGLDDVLLAGEAHLDQLTDDVCLRLAEVFGQLPDVLSRAVAEPHDDGVRYALIVSIEAPDVEGDLWTPISAQIRIPAAVTITT
jgi:hypothetical protein